MRNTVDTSNLVDIRDVRVDSALPQRERISEYNKQIKDPHYYKCGGITVRAIFPDNGVSIEDCLRPLATV